MTMRDVPTRKSTIDIAGGSKSAFSELSNLIVKMIFYLYCIAESYPIIKNHQHTHSHIIKALNKFVDIQKFKNVYLVTLHL